ncbi:MAG: Rieske (2Fe-2S) protein [Chryseolinea sp.]
MEWLKLFESESEARARIKEHKPQLLIVNSKRICLSMHQGQFYAVQDACSHHGESLSKGIVNFMGEIVCPLHHYRFELSSGRATDSSCPDLITFDLKSNESGFFIGI